MVNEELLLCDTKNIKGLHFLGITVKIVPASVCMLDLSIEIKLLRCFGSAMLLKYSERSESAPVRSASRSRSGTPMASGKSNGHARSPSGSRPRSSSHHSLSQSPVRERSAASRSSGGHEASRSPSRVRSRSRDDRRVRRSRSPEERKRYRSRSRDSRYRRRSGAGSSRLSALRVEHHSFKLRVGCQIQISTVQHPSSNTQLQCTTLLPPPPTVSCGIYNAASS
ncbi:hypothetical protein DINM_004983 [Dirofilaria immitis]|nr:hypothetical protein [Dirofilaria immitis]